MICWELLRVSGLIIIDYAIGLYHCRATTKLIILSVECTHVYAQRQIQPLLRVGPIGKPISQSTFNWNETMIYRKRISINLFLRATWSSGLRRGRRNLRSVRTSESGPFLVLNFRFCGVETCWRRRVWNVALRLWQKWLRRRRDRFYKLGSQIRLHQMFRSEEDNSAVAVASTAHIR